MRLPRGPSGPSSPRWYRIISYTPAVDASPSLTTRRISASVSAMSRSRSMSLLTVMVIRV